MEYLEVDEEGSYGLAADGKWYITPLGLAQWADEEGGWEDLLYGHGDESFLEVGVNPLILSEYQDARGRMEEELRRIGAYL